MRTIDRTCAGAALIAVALCGACGSHREAPPASAPAAPTAAPAPAPVARATADVTVDGGAAPADLPAEAFAPLDEGGAGVGNASLGGAVIAELAPSPPAREARLSTDAPTVGGGLTPDVIRRVILSRMAAIKGCYERELAARPTLGGRLKVSFTIGADGKVAKTDVTGFDPKVDACLAGVIRALVFPPPAGGGSVTVNYPFNFDNAAAADPPRADVSQIIARGDTRAAFADDQIMGGLTGDAEAEAGLGLGPGSSGTFGHGAARSPLRFARPTVSGGYDEAIVRRQVQRESAKLERCYTEALATTPSLRGVIVLEYDIGAKGTVSGLTTLGLDGEAARCIGAVIAKGLYPKPPRGATVHVTQSMVFAPP